MSQDRQISSRRLFRIVTGISLAAIFFVALVAATFHQGSRRASGLVVNILNENEHNFIRKSDVEALLKGNPGINLSNKTMNTIDLGLIEKTVESNPWIVNADVFVDNQQQLNVDITQRVPVARLFHTNGSSSYLDSTLKVLPLSNNYAYSAPVFTNVPFLGKDSLSTQLKSRIAALSNVIASDTFWNAQITQIDLQPDQSFVLIPMVGDQKILFGDTAFAKDKLSNLLGFYRKVSSKIGWNRYEVLDVRFKDQVIASPAIGYVPPRNEDTASDPIMEALVVPVAAAPDPKPTSSAAPKTVVKPVVPVAKQIDKKPEAMSKPVAKKTGSSVKKATEKPAPVKSKTNDHVAARPTNSKPASSKAVQGKYIYTGKNDNHK